MPDLNNNNYISYWPNGVMKEMGSLVNSQNEGEWLIFNEEGILMVTTNWMFGSSHVSFLYSITFHNHGSKSFYEKNKDALLSFNKL